MRYKRDSRSTFHPFENVTGKMCGKVSENISNEEAEKAFENVTGNSQAGKTEVGNLHDRYRSACRNG